jgi:hypothetical protein
MIREVDLVSYLPPFMKKFKEMVTVQKAENPEFILVWSATEQTLSNQFIATADEYGIAQYEEMLGILPYKEDTLDSRRSRLQNAWYQQTPYTMRSLVEKMKLLYGESNFAITKQYDSYKIIVNTTLDIFGQLPDLRTMLDNMIPCNMVIDLHNVVASDAEANIKVGSYGRITPVFITERR